MLETKDVLVSVIMIAYNQKKYIRKAIESVLMQRTDFSFEVLIGDDGSIDGTSEIVSEYSRKYPEIVKAKIREENIGATRNSYDLLCSARGKYLATCEGDDYWTDELKLQKQVDFLEKNTQYVGCVHPIIFVDENNEQLKNSRINWISDKKIFRLSDFEGYKMPGHVVSMVRVNYMRYPDFDKKFIYTANPLICDRTCALLWLSRGDFYRLDDTMAAYRIITDGSNTTSKKYKDNDRRFTDDYEYTLVLENYAKNTLHVDAGFDKHKRELFAKAVLLAPFRRKSYDNRLPRRILKENGRILWYLIGIFVYPIQRVFHR